MPPKFASPFSLIKTPIQQTKLYTIYNARNKETNQIWIAKVIHSAIVEQYGISKHVAYNQQALDNLTEKQHILYVNQIFYKDDDSFLIMQKYETRLSDYLSKKETIDAIEVEKIIRDIFQAVCQIYEESYVHRSIRPEHIVLVKGDTQIDDLWKIQTLVLDNQQFPNGTPFTWKRQTASPEDRNGKLTQQKQDSQIVWNFGYLSLQLLMGNKFMKKDMTSDSDVQWIKIKQKCSKTPALYQLIQKCFRFQFNSRISLRNFFQLKIFDGLCKMDISQYFLTASSIFKAKTLSSLQMSINQRSMNMKSINLASKIHKNIPVLGRSFQVVEEDQNEEEEEMNFIRATFLSGIHNYLKQLQLPKEQIKQKDSRIIIEYYTLKLVKKYFQKPPKSQKSKGFKNESDSKINVNSKFIKQLRAQDSMLIKKLGINTQIEYEQEKLISIFNQLCGYAYSRIKDNCQKVQNNHKIRALAYFGLAGYLVNMTSWKDLISSLPEINDKKLNYLQIFEKTDLQKVIKVAQDLTAKYFITAK